MAHRTQQPPAMPRLPLPMRPMAPDQQTLQPSEISMNVVEPNVDILAFTALATIVPTIFKEQA